MNANKLVIGLTGMPGCGKSIVVQAAAERGYDCIAMGDVVREETASRGLELNPVNVGRVMLELREKEGAAVVALKCVPKIKQKANAKIIVDGLRSYVEAETFKAEFPSFILITVHSSPDSRFQRLCTRGRSDDPKTWEVFHERDMRELRVGIGNAIALADYVVVNDSDEETGKSRALETLEKAEKKWTE